MRTFALHDRIDPDEANDEEEVRRFGAALG
jgi:hypothetical protein